MNRLEFQLLVECSGGNQRSVTDPESCQLRICILLELIYILKLISYTVNLVSLQIFCLHVHESSTKCSGMETLVYS